MYNTVDDASLRLKDTVVSDNKGNPLFITGAKTADVMYAHRYTKMGVSRDRVEVSFRRGEISIKPLPLGYVNISGEAIYLSRVPARKYKQGLSDATLWTKCHKGVRTPSSRKILTSPSFMRCVTNQYRGLEECFNALEEGVVNSIAFHRNWAIDTSGFPLDDDGAVIPEATALIYKGSVVGYITQGRAILFKEFQYLKESAEEAGL